MRNRFALMGLVMIGCTSPNPRSCKDGLCSDQSFPFCDIDGSLQGTPQTCIAVACTVGEAAGCRGDTALVCNGAGNDYDLVSCPRGCDAQVGCLECTANDQCSTSRGICGVNGTCRQCAADDECESRVCDAGVCAAESGVLYAASGVPDNTACSRSSPCSVAHALALAIPAAVRPIVRVLPGVYTQGLAISAPTSGPLRIVATGATIASLRLRVAERTIGRRLGQLRLEPRSPNAHTVRIVHASRGEPLSSV